MQQSEIDQLSSRIRTASTILRISAASLRVRIAAKYNPNWHLQPRVPAGNPAGGQWLAGAFGAVANLLPVLRQVGAAALRRLFNITRETAPRLRSVPRRWEGEPPAEDTYDSETLRISPYSKQRPGQPSIRFRTERELKRYLGPAGPGNELHRIVEGRLAGKPFDPTLIHSTDNIINLPVEVHRYISRKMSTKDPEFGGDIRRFWVEKLPFGEQYDHGLELIEEVLKEFGYDPEDF